MIPLDKKQSGVKLQPPLGSLGKGGSVSRGIITEQEKKKGFFKVHRMLGACIRQVHLWQ